MLLPAGVLLVIGMIFQPQLPDPAIGGRRYIDLLAPSMVVISLATLGVNLLPPRLVKYRERGVLRRLSTTPVDPAALVIAQLLVNMAVAVGGLVVLMVAGNLAFGVPFPQNPIGFVAAFLLGMLSLFALGLLIASIAPTAGAATAITLPLFSWSCFSAGSTCRCGCYPKPWSGSASSRPRESRQCSRHGRARRRRCCRSR